MEFYVNQVPAETVKLTVVDETRQARNLSAYSAAAILFTSPSGQTVQGGVAVFTSKTNGTLQYTFPPETLFTEVGQYEMRVKLTAGTRTDYTNLVIVDVRKALE